MIIPLPARARHEPVFTVVKMAYPREDHLPAVIAVVLPEGHPFELLWFPRPGAGLPELGEGRV
jgi:hypothetical protein